MTDAETLARDTGADPETVKEEYRAAAIMLGIIDAEDT